MTKISHIARLAFEYKINRLVLSYPPYMLSIEVTNYCNFKCKFCPQSDPEHNKRREQGMLGTNNFCEFVRKVKETLNSNRNISLTLDGEPTLNKSFSDFIRIANEYGLFPRFSSNGFLLTPEYTDQLLKAGRFLAAIDFASEARYFDGVRGFEGSFEKV